LHLRRTIFLLVVLCAPASLLYNTGEARPQVTAKPTAQDADAGKSSDKPQDRTQDKSQDKPQDKTPASTEPQTPAQITLLETHYRFEADGSSRKEVHTIVKINSELGVRQFAHLNFDYNRDWQTIEIPMVRVTHSSGGTADVLPSAITDAPNEAVKDAPAYQDVRVKAVRILGLAPSDTLEYRVITTSGKSPLAPNFWFEHSFDRTGVVSQESLEVDVPDVRGLESDISPETPASSTNKTGAGESARTVYRWDRGSARVSRERAADDVAPDVSISTLAPCTVFASKVFALFSPSTAAIAEVSAKGAQLTSGLSGEESKMAAVYDFVSQKIATIDLPLGATGFRTRAPAEILASGVATAEDKFVLFAALAAASGIHSQALLTGPKLSTEVWSPSPAVFTRLVVHASAGHVEKWLDPAVEVAPFGMIPAEFRGKSALAIDNWIMVGADQPLADIGVKPWRAIPDTLPFPAAQHVSVKAALDGNGTLTARVKYLMRGDNELLLRIAFHQSPREKWANLAQLLSLSDGFRGKITSVSASEPLETKDPFTVEYEIAQPKFVDWSKKPVRIPALLPLFALPDPPAQPNMPIELGTPLDVETSATLTLPPGFTAQPPTGTSVTRDYATFTSKYSFGSPAGTPSIIASRHINFLARQLPALNNADYRAFLRAVQNDEAQSFTILKP
jgi:uncharacterized protein DUF3857